MKYFKAETFGQRVVKSTYTGNVHSVFTAACNIQTFKGELVTLLNQTKPDQPGGIRVAVPEDFSFSDWVKSSDHVFFQPSYLQIEEPNFFIDMRQAAVWDGRLKIHLTDYSTRSLIHQWEASAGLYLSLVHKNSNSSKGYKTIFSGEYFLPKLYTLAIKLTAATKKHDWKVIDRTICSLIGFGPGLTPWGDDFLCGFMAGLESFCHSGDEKKILEYFRNVLFHNIKATGDISRSALNDVINGQHARSVTDTCRALFDSTSTLDFSTEAKNLIGTGNTSGEATYLGILSGSAAAIKYGLLYKKNYKQLMSALTKKFSLEIGQRVHSA